MVDGDGGLGEGKPKVPTGAESVRECVHDSQENDDTERVSLIDSRDRISTPPICRDDTRKASVPRLQQSAELWRGVVVCQGELDE